MRNDREDALAVVPDLLGLLPQLEVYEGLLRRWQTKINLVGPSTLGHIWMRHFADSAQLFRFLPAHAACVDLGSGAGFPGLVLALLLKTSGQFATMRLVESDRRKAAFLREVSRETGADVEVVAERAETDIANSHAPDFITSRALGPLERLIALTDPWLAAGSTGLFLAGEADTTSFSADKLCVTSTPSRTGSGFVVTVRGRESEQG